MFNTKAVPNTLIYLQKVFHIFSEVSKYFPKFLWLLCWIEILIEKKKNQFSFAGRTRQLTRPDPTRKVTRTALVPLCEPLPCGPTRHCSPSDDWLPLCVSPPAREFLSPITSVTHCRAHPRVLTTVIPIAAVPRRVDHRHPLVAAALLACAHALGRLVPPCIWLRYCCAAVMPEANHSSTSHVQRIAACRVCRLGA
jgi:hypothetical protein